MELQDLIRAKLDEIYEYAWSDGAVLFKADLCTEDEKSRLRESGVLDTVARILAEEIENARSN